jgi:hypothetical protein
MFVSAQSPRRPALTLIQAPRVPCKGTPSAASGASELNAFTRDTEEKPVTLGTILLIVLVLMLVGAFPSWSHSRSWGYGPSGGLGLVLVVVVVLLLMGRI